MNIILVAVLLAAIYFLLESGLVFFAIIVAVALLLAIISSAFSGRSGRQRDLKQAYPERPAVAAPYQPQYVKQEHNSLQNFWKTVGMVFNFVGKCIYQFLTRDSHEHKEKHEMKKYRVKMKEYD